MKRKTLLLIGSSQVLMDLTKKILERANYSVRCTVGIAGAREHFIDFTPDGIVLDNDLPDGKGLDYCRELRKESTLPIMFLSNSKEDELPALQAGVNDFLKKPYDHCIMIARIGTMLQTGAVFSQVTDSDENAEQSAAAIAKFQEPKTAAAYKSVKRICKTHRFYIAVATCVLFMFIGIGVHSLLNGLRSPLEIPNGQAPLSESPVQMDANAKPYDKTLQGILFPSIESVTVPRNTTNVKMLLLNPADNQYNQCYLTFEIVLKDTSESIYSSGLVKPGMCITEIVLSKGLPKGKHDAIMKICVYSMEDFAAMNRAIVEFCLTAN